jgi:phosphatidylserine/phosphatidylglycerophosphate/cardiolipin synthase-like enzyme
MLNVAVSRAKRSFLVFGDMDIFNTADQEKPSSLLAKYLFAQEANEIVDVIPYEQSKMSSESIRQITSLEGHQKALQQSFVRAERALVIVSPFLRVHAISTDKIPALIKEHAQRIAITIYTDPGLNQGHWEEFKHAKAMLETAGAQVILVNNVHSKIITIDDRLIIQGSFNWLSASRSDQYGREETSIVYKGEHVARFIEEAMEPIKRKAKDVALQRYREAVVS